MIKTIIILIATLIILPLVAFRLDPQPLPEVSLHMLKVSGLMALGLALSCYLLAEITGNCSQVDKIWSVAPIIYVWYFAAAGQWDPRTMLMAACATIWGVRLTYNFGRKGAYKLKFWTGEEDYRWEVLRQNPIFKDKPWNWRFFNLFFISIYQNALIWLFTLPAVMVYAGRDQPISIVDGLLAGLYISLVVMETIADEQQWLFQKEKHRRIAAGEPLEGIYAGGFVHTGLWARVRHPNYACEQAIWMVFYLFTISATGSYVNWSLAGALLLLILFQGSSDFSEGISLSKYPGYKDYVKRTPRFLPGFR